MNMLTKAALLAAAFSISLGLSSASNAEKIYLWYTTDKNGKRVPKYGATPPKGVEATLISESKPSANAGKPAAPKPSAEAPISEQQKAVAKQRKEACDAEQQRLNTLETNGGRIRLTGEDGTSRYLSPEEVMKEIEASKDFLKNACGAK